MPITTPDTGDVWTTQGPQVIAALNDFENADAEYAESNEQTIANTQGTVVAYGTAVRTSSLVTRSTQGAGHKFTLNRSGVWMISTTIRWRWDGSGGERYMVIGGTTHLTSNGVILGTFTGPVCLNAAACGYLSANDYVQVEAWHNAGADRYLEAGWSRIDLVWMHA